MQFIKFLFGIVLVQILSIALLVLAPETFEVMDMVRLGLPLLFVALVVAFWFVSISGHAKKDAILKEKEQHNKEREKLQVNAERAKTRVMKQAQKDIAREAKTAHAKANFKVGIAVTGAVGVGLLFVVAQMFTVGLLIFSAAGGVVGYYWRGRRQIANAGKYVEIENTSKKLENILKN
ncbi:MAG TPA: hypothetical protein ENK86_01355 [Campylobacterales bacterium]|nr:hypothetical protein [Campylobacterales bacterium]